MRYSDGNEAMLGDTVAIDDRYRGLVVACIDRSEYTAEHPAEQWSYLEQGAMIETDFAGLVHYTEPLYEFVVLVSRRSSNPSFQPTASGGD